MTYGLAAFSVKITKPLTYAVTSIVKITKLLTYRIIRGGYTDKYIKKNTEYDSKYHKQNTVYENKYDD